MFSFALIASCAGISVNGTIQHDGLSPYAVPLSTRITLQNIHTTHTSRIDTSGRFSFDVEEGSYTLTLSSQLLDCTPLRVDVSRFDVAVYTAPLGLPSIKRNPQAYPIHLAVTVKETTKQERFNPLSILRNPMVGIGIVMVISLFGIPRLTAYLDPEGIAEMERIKAERANAGQETQSEAVSKITNFDVSGWLAGKK